jgi:hypothetical protein
MKLHKIISLALTMACFTAITTGASAQQANNAPSAASKSKATNPNFERMRVTNEKIAQQQAAGKNRPVNAKAQQAKAAQQATAGKKAQVAGPNKGPAPSTPRTANQK